MEYFIKKGKCKDLTLLDRAVWIVLFKDDNGKIYHQMTADTYEGAKRTLSELKSGYLRKQLNWCEGNKYRCDSW
jgi:hypothetical protein